MMKTYERYKPSGIEWIGDIPEHWNVKRLKYLITDKLKYGANESADLEDLDQPRYIRITDFGEDGKLREDTFKSLPREVAEEYLLKDGDILFARSGATVGKTFQFKNYDGLACFAGYLIKARPDEKQILTDFLYYFTKSSSYENWRNGIFIQATIQNIGADKYSLLEITLPSSTEQTVIVNYLDKKTAQIDKLIEGKRGLIALLKEERLGIINKAITRGINPHAKLKPSSIDWLGEIPTHWEVKKLKYAVNAIVDTEHKTVSFYEDEKYYVARTSDIRNGVLLIGKMRRTNREGFEEWTKRGKPIAGDILFTREAPAGEACVVPDQLEVCLGQRMVLFKTNHKVAIPQLIVHLIYSNVAKEYINQLAQGSTVSHFNMADIRNIPLVLPPIHEQNQIVHFIETETSKIDATAAKIEKEIEYLREYRTALISEVVTGKIKVV